MTTIYIWSFLKKEMEIMKYLFVLLLLSFLIVYCACSSSPEQISSAQQNQNPTVTPPTKNQNKSEESYLAEDEDVVNRSGEIQMVFMGYLDFKNSRIVSENDWSVGYDNEIELKKGLVFDVMTCAGFVSKAKLKKWHGESNRVGSNYAWEMEFISDKTSKYDNNALKSCREKGSNWIRAFAVFPAKVGREKIQIQNTPDLKGIFDSISSRDKKWIASDDPKNTGYLGGKKKDPDIESWTDSDGDGQIDLIEVKGNCNGQSDGDLICMQILHLSNNKWIRVGWLATD